MSINPVSEMEEMKLQPNLTMGRIQMSKMNRKLDVVIDDFGSLTGTVLVP